MAYAGPTEPKAGSQRLCCYCNKPVMPGQPRWNGDIEGLSWHYSCAEQAGRTTPWSSRLPREIGTGSKR